jgi:hypothetical protein
MYLKLNVQTRAETALAHLFEQLKDFQGIAFQLFGTEHLIRWTEIGKHFRTSDNSTIDICCEIFHSWVCVV